MSQDTVFCGQCGASIAAAARFCARCGAPQEEVLEAAGEPVPPPPPRRPPAPGSAPAPAVGELASQLVAQLSTPGAIVAGTAAACALGTMLLFGLVAAIVTPDRSIVGFAGSDSSVVEEALRLAVASLMAQAEAGGDPGTLVPLLAVLVPVLGAAAGAWVQAHRLGGAPLRTRLAWGAAAGVPLALLSLVLALVAGGEIRGQDIDFRIGGVLLLALLWGAAGGMLGIGGRAWRAGEREALGALVPAAARPWLLLAWIPLKALGVALLAAAAIGLAVWEVQTWKGEDSARVAVLDRGTATATIENAAFGPEIGIGALGLGIFGHAEIGEDDALGTQVLPVSDDVDPEDVRDFLDIGDDIGPRDEASYGLLDYRHVYPAYTFVPLLLLLVGIPLLLMLYAGFAIARTTGARVPAWGAAHGLSVGVVWALALMLLRLVGDVDIVTGGSLFACALLIGAGMGAIGGALAALGSSQQAG